LLCNTGKLNNNIASEDEENIISSSSMEEDTKPLATALSVAKPSVNILFLNTNHNLGYNSRHTGHLCGDEIESEGIQLHMVRI
jgi:hypothetical protein